MVGGVKWNKDVKVIVPGRSQAGFTQVDIHRDQPLANTYLLITPAFWPAKWVTSQMPWDCSCTGPPPAAPSSSPAHSASPPRLRRP